MRELGYKRCHFLNEHKPFLLAPEKRKKKEDPPVPFGTLHGVSATGILVILVLIQVHGFPLSMEINDFVTY